MLMLLPFFLPFKLVVTLLFCILYLNMILMSHALDVHIFTYIYIIPIGAIARPLFNCLLIVDTESKTA